MKKQTLLFLLLFIVFFSSCVNHDYDLNNDKIDKNVLLSADGINLPYGNVDRIVIYEKLGYDKIQVAADGSLYVEFDGSLNPTQFSVPNYSLPSIGDATTGAIPISGISGKFDSSILPSNSFTLLTGQTVNYTVPAAEFENTDWTIVPNQIVFDSFTINLNPVLQGFSNVSGNAKLTLYITIPQEFEIDEPFTTGRIITRTIDFSNTASVTGIKVKSYKYPANGGASSISFDLKLENMSGFTADVSNPSFNLTFSTDNNNVAINSISGKVTGKQPITDEISGITDLKNSFGYSAILQFENPSLFFSVNTNLGADFNLDIDKIYADNGVSLSLTGNNGLQFLKNAQQPTAYFIAPNPDQGAPAGATKRALPLDNLFTYLPSKINYDFSFNVNDPNATIASTGIILQGDYKFTLPFSFKNLKVNVDIPPFSMEKNIYNDIIQYITDTITIKSDTIDISAEKINQLTLTATVQFLDTYQKTIENINAKSVTLTNGLNIDKFVFDFSKQDLDNLKNVQYLKIGFILEGNGALTKDDYIDIHGLRFISKGGILYDFSL